MQIESRTVHKLRIFARVWSLLSIAFVRTMFIGEALSGEGTGPTAVEGLEPVSLQRAQCRL